MKLYFKAVMLVGTLLLTNSAYAHDGEDHSGGLSFIPPISATPLLPKPNPITPMVTTPPAVTTSAPVTTPKPIITSGNPNQQFITSVPSPKPTTLPPLLTFTPITPKPAVTTTSLPPLLTFSPLTPAPVVNHSGHGTTTTAMNDLLHPIHTMTTGTTSAGTNVSEPLGLVSIMGAMLGFMMVRRKKES